MFKTRLISGIVLVIIAFITIYTGGPLLWITLCGISLIGLNELYKVIKIDKTLPGIAGYLATLVYYLLLLGGISIDPMLFVIAVLVVFMFIYVFAFPKYVFEQISGGFLGVFYVSVMLSFIYQTRMRADGLVLVPLVFLCSWGCDTCAYCAGVLFGKHKMAPKLSPKKSIEGGIGGLVGAALLGALYALAVNHRAGQNVTPVEYAVICLIGGMISMVGDLAASAIKRNYQIKDYGTLIPGHGGILDRFDSVIFTAPAIYYLAVLLL